MSNTPRADITLRNVTLALLDAAGCDTSQDQPCILIDAPARKLTLAQAAELHTRLGSLLAEQFTAMLAGFRTRARNRGRIDHTSPITDPPPRGPATCSADHPTGVPSPCGTGHPAGASDFAAPTLHARDGRRTRRLKPRGTALGLRLTRERAARGWTQAELARRATALRAGPRIYPNYISEIESGRRTPTPSQLLALSRALGLLKGELARLSQGTNAPAANEPPMQQTA